MAIDREEAKFAAISDLNATNVSTQREPELNTATKLLYSICRRNVLYPSSAFYYFERCGNAGVQASAASRNCSHEELPKAYIPANDGYFFVRVRSMKISVSFSSLDINPIRFLPSAEAGRFGRQSTGIAVQSIRSRVKASVVARGRQRGHWMFCARRMRSCVPISVFSVRTQVARIARDTTSDAHHPGMYL